MPRLGLALKAGSITFLVLLIPAFLIWHIFVQATTEPVSPHQADFAHTTATCQWAQPPSSTTWHDCTEAIPDHTKAFAVRSTINGMTVGAWKKLLPSFCYEMYIYEPSPGEQFTFAPTDNVGGADSASLVTEHKFTSFRTEFDYLPRPSTVDLSLRIYCGHNMRPKLAKQYDFLLS